jgi:hypothetical protein
LLIISQIAKFMMKRNTPNVKALEMCLFHVNKECATYAPMTILTCTTQLIGVSIYSRQWNRPETKKWGFQLRISLSLWLGWGEMPLRAKLQGKRILLSVPHAVPLLVQQSVMINLSKVKINACLLETFLSMNEQGTFKYGT